MKTKQLFVSLTLSLGLTVALLWFLGTGSMLAANFNVTKFTDGNDDSCDPDDCSLREAIQESNDTPGPDTITLLTGTHTLTITGAYEDKNATGDLDITEALTITGAGPDVTIIDASGLSDRVLHVLTGPVVISGVTIRNGSGIDQGGGILNKAVLTLINSAVVTNSASNGGGIFNDGGVLTLTNSTFSGNTAGYGGGIANGGTVQLSNCTISSNTAYTNGGGIDNWTNSIAELTNSTVSSNTAGTDGGGIFNNGGVLTLTNSTIISNTADESGGGIKNGDGGTVELTNSTIRDNQATAVDGGGIDNYQGGTVKLANSTVSGNTADRDGGGIDNGGDSTVELTNSTFSGNTAGYGGGIANQGTVRLTNCTISSNTAYTNGGGINTWENSIVELTNSTVSSNTASYGGGLRLFSSDAVLTNIVVADNQANTAGSGLYIGASSPHLLHTTIARNSGGDGSGVHITGIPSTVALTNTILVSHTVGITVAAGNTATLEATLWGADAWANLADWGGAGTIITGTVNLWGAPDFVDPDAGDYHIGSNSAAIDAGVDAGVDDDIDGDPRPTGTDYDIGADEYYYPALDVTKKADPDPVKLGTQLTYTLRLTNTGNVTLTATVIDTLPNQVTLGGVRTWTPTITAPGGIWTKQVTVTVEKGYCRPLINVVQVTTEEGATGVYTETSTAIGECCIYLPVILKSH